MLRRLMAPILTFVLALCIARLAWAGSYLDRAALLLSEADHATFTLRSHLADKEFARLVHEVSLARLQAASHMQVPKEIAQAHPHLLLVLENCERASDAARLGDSQRFLFFLQKATEEERILRSVVEQLGWALPKP
jgi:hypothetical protein